MSHEPKVLEFKPVETEKPDLTDEEKTRLNKQKILKLRQEHNKRIQQEYRLK